MDVPLFGKVKVKKGSSSSPFSAVTDFAGDVIDTAGEIVTAPINVVAKATKSIPVLGDVTRIVSKAASAPIDLASSIASGARIDRAVIGHLKAQLKTVKEAAPYAQMVISVVPGVGTGVSAAIAAGVALAEGRSIDEIGKAAIRGSIPGGPIAVAAYDTALRVAAGGNVAQAAIESARAALPENVRQAFDVGLAVVTGENIQNAITNGLVALAPEQVQQVLSAGERAIASVPGLKAVAQAAKNSHETYGMRLASGLLSQAGVNQKAVAALRDRLAPNQKAGFDAVLRAQESDVAWLGDVLNPPLPPAGRRPPAVQPVATRPAPARPPALTPVQAPVRPPPAVRPVVRAAPASTAVRVPGRVVYGPYPG